MRRLVFAGSILPRAAKFAAINDRLTRTQRACCREKGWTVRVEGANRIGQQGSAVRRAQGGTGFSLPEAETSAPAQKAFGVSTVPGLDVLLALQSVDMTVERRRKGTARGRRILDILD